MICPAIQFDKVSKSFITGRNTTQVIKNLSLSIQQGEVFGFLGPNGAGKSTTIKLLLNFIHPDSGKICIAGKNIQQDEFRFGIGYLPEIPFFNNQLTAKETLVLSGRLSRMNYRLIVDRMHTLLQQLNLQDALDLRINNFSKGMKQRLGLACALLHDPDVLIFDEPMSGLDPLGRLLMKKIIRRLKQDKKTIFFSSHILSDVESVCDNIAILHKGHLLYSGRIESFLPPGRSLEESFINAIAHSDNALRT